MKKHWVNSEIPWRKIIDFRNVVAHDYADLDLSIVWQIVTKDLVKLRLQLDTILIDQSVI